MRQEFNSSSRLCRGCKRMSSMSVNKLGKCRVNKTFSKNKAINDGSYACHGLANINDQSGPFSGGKPNI